MPRSAQLLPLLFLAVLHMQAVLQEAAAGAYPGHVACGRKVHEWAVQRESPLQVERCQDSRVVDGLQGRSVGCRLEERVGWGGGVQSEYIGVGKGRLSRERKRGGRRLAWASPAASGQVLHWR